MGLSRPRRFMLDMLHFAKQLPSIPVQRRMNLKAVAAARLEAGRPCWPAVFLKAYALVAEQMPALRRAYVQLPWPHIVEYSKSVASVAVERDLDGEPAVFYGRISSPARYSVAVLDERIVEFSTAPIPTVKPFRKLLSFARWPGPLRRLGMWLALNIAPTRAAQFGTFGLTVYSALGAESLHPISPLTTTLTYGVIGADGSVDVRLIYDHRVLEGTTVARALKLLEDRLTGEVADELRGMASGRRAAA